MIKENKLILRSLLFVPGHISKFYAKALKSDADCIIFDIEDGVPLNQKKNAINCIKKNLDQLTSEKILLVRTNNFKSKNFYSELKEIFVPKLYGYVIPKIETEKEIVNIDKLLTILEKKGKLKRKMAIFPLIETASSIANLEKIASSSRRVSGLIFGHEDYLLNIKAPYMKDEKNLLYARSKIVITARLTGCLPIDTPYLKISDKNGCVKKSQESKSLGFSGMLALNPKQTTILNKSFSPSKKEIAIAEKIIKLSKKNHNNKRNILFDKGVFVGPPILKKAKQTLKYKNKISKIK